MKVVVVGLRGFPNIQGGIETHCEELYPRLASLGEEVTVVRRKGFVREQPVRTSYRGVRFKDIAAPSVTGLEAAVHSLWGVWYAWRSKANIVHIHAIGPSIAIPLAKVLGLRVVMTHHGPDYEREKWGPLARFVLKTGERFAAWWADDIISISTVICHMLEKKYHRTRRVHLVYNGITTLPAPDGTDYLQQIGVEPGKYILAVGRFVPEKRFDKLVKAYSRLGRKDCKLVIAGDADYPSAYARQLKEKAIRQEVVLTGMVKGDKLAQLYAHAALFVLPSSHEGLPITLLEAMSYRRKVLASDIPANKAIGLPPENYFHTNDPAHLTSRIASLLDNGQDTQAYDLSKYDWDHIAEQVRQVYHCTDCTD